MRILLDQGCPRATVHFLAANSVDAEHVGDLGLASASDEVILDTARRSGAIIVTLDSDFHRALAISGAKEPSVIRIRVQGLKGQRLAEIVAQTLTSIGNELVAGAVATVTPAQIRVRRLPLNG